MDIVISRLQIKFDWIYLQCHQISGKVNNREGTWKSLVEGYTPFTSTKMLVIVKKMQ